MDTIDTTNVATGYRSADYAASFETVGRPRRLAASGGWVIEREIGGSQRRDVEGCYPVFCCDDWYGLSRDIDALREESVSITLVTDPFSTPGADELSRLFQIVRPLRPHYVVDLTTWSEGKLTTRHRRTLRATLRRGTEVRMESRPVEFLDQWVELYSTLVGRHAIDARRRFSRSIFESQLRVPGAVMFSAHHNGQVVGAHWYFVDGRHVYGHLAACSPDGYRVAAAYALHAAAIDHFRGSCEALSIGGVPTIASSGTDGLVKFKAGWGTIMRPIFLCGAILDIEAYQTLEARSGAGSTFFPSYRANEYAQ